MRMEKSCLAGALRRKVGEGLSGNYREVGRRKRTNG